VHLPLVLVPKVSQNPLQHTELSWHLEPLPLHPPLPAVALFASPKQASSVAARPKPNLFRACRRVVDWANPLAS
jgi:hypothetical protein